MENPPILYPEGAGFPSGLIPELAGVGSSLHYIDNASINTSNAMVACASGSDAQSTSDG